MIRLLPAAAGLLAALGASAASTPEQYVEYCAHCHAAGIAGAPKIGDRDDWARRIRPGMHKLYRSALNGVANTAMMAKGGHRDLADADVRALVDYMIAAAGLTQELLAAAARYDALGIANLDFIRLDADFDGGLSPAEVAGDPELARSLARFDDDRDGKLSEAEYLRAEAALERERAAVEVDDATLAANVRAALAKVKGMPSGVKVEVSSGVVVVTAMVDDAEVARRGFAAIKRIKGIKKIDDRMISAQLLSWD